MPPMTFGTAAGCRRARIVDTHCRRPAHLGNNTHRDGVYVTIPQRFIGRDPFMTSPAIRTTDSHHISAVALDLLRRPSPSRRGSADPAAMREWIEKRLASGSGTISGIELHREIEGGIP